MDSRKVLLILGLVCVAACLVLPKKPYKRQFRMGRHRDGFVLKKRVDVPQVSGVSGDLYLAQKVDHFDPSNTNTYQQRYWYNDQWYKPGGPIFLYINGEAEGDSYEIQGGMQLTQLAQTLNAMTFAIEHRYYGLSTVNNNADLKYLSSRQMLADIADFIKAMNTQYNYQNPKWVTFGGSYAGALTAWSRMLYPDLIFGGVGSSGPVQAQVDFGGYLEVVQDVISTYTNPSTNINCGQTVKDALAQVETYMKTSSGRQKLFKDFQTCTPLDTNKPLDIATFYSTLLDNLMGDVQYNGQAGYSFLTDCQPLTDTGNGADAYSRFQAWANNVYGGFGCIDISFEDEVNEYKQNPGDQLWFWQTCTEFGYFQSTDSPKDLSFYGNPTIVPADWYVQQCTGVFGSAYTNATVYASIDKTNAFYHGQNGYSGTRVVLPNGLSDPWHVLGVLTTPNVTPADYTVKIQGASHCQDMDGDDPSDSPALAAAKKQIRSYVLGWFNQ